MSDRIPGTPDEPTPGDRKTEKLVSWLDHELSPEEAEAVESDIARDPKTRREARGLRKAWDLLDLLPRTEPSADFTRKTLSRLDIPRIAPGSATDPTSPIVPAPLAPPAVAAVRQWLPVVLSLLAVACLVGLGWQTRQWVHPHSHRGTGSVEAGRIAEPTEFLETLALPTWFGRDHRDSPISESNPARLARTQEMYLDWLEHLPTAERQKLLEVSTWQERLPLVRKLRDDEWLKTLPKAQRDQYAREPDSARRRELIAQWRLEEEERRIEWEYATRNWKETPASQLGGLLKEEAFRREILTFAQGLEPRLSTVERENLRALWPEVDSGPWELFVRRLHPLADRHALWPGTGAAKFDELPKEWRDKLPELERGKKSFAVALDLLKVPARYPEYAIAVSDYAKGKNLTFKTAPGSCRIAEMPIEVQKWLAEVRRQKAGDIGRRRLRELDDAEGHWPDYPRRMLEVVKEFRLPIPGTSSPTWRLPESLTGRVGPRK